MDQDYRLKFDRMRQNNPTGEKAQEEQKSDAYTYATSTRNLSLVWPDGRRLFLNYAYLISGEYFPTERNITLLFTTHKIVLQGIRLDTLYDDFLMHVPRIITCTDPRYTEIEDGKFCVETILAEKVT